MKVLIAYAGKNGSTLECVSRLKAFLPHQDVTLCDLAKATPDLREYDLCVAGGSVRFARLQKPLRRFLKEQSEELIQKPLALFFLCGLAHEVEYYTDTLYSKKLKRAAFGLTYFGGSLRTDGLSFFDRLMVKSLRSSIVESDIEDGEYTPTMPGILPENIEKMSTAVKEQLRMLKEH